jgi:hypothetical protein
MIFLDIFSFILILAVNRVRLGKTLFSKLYSSSLSALGGGGGVKVSLTPLISSKNILLFLIFNLIFQNKVKQACIYKVVLKSIFKTRVGLLSKNNFRDIFGAFGT